MTIIAINLLCLHTVVIVFSYNDCKAVVHGERKVCQGDRHMSQEARDEDIKFLNDQKGDDVNFGIVGSDV